MGFEVSGGTLGSPFFFSDYWFCQAGIVLPCLSSHTLHVTSLFRPVGTAHLDIHPASPHRSNLPSLTVCLSVCLTYLEQSSSRRPL